ncbi:MAG: ASCH domain-containing protein [Deltaproteobacteria bacterium]|nr:ASCH domain-containing protein [Deltaproteobacteria bacterium]
MTNTASAEPVYAITLHQPWASLIAMGLKAVETRSWPAPARLVGQRIAVHAGKRLVRQPGECIERKLRAQWGEDWRVNIPTGAVVATAVLAGMAQAAHIDPLTGHAVHDPATEVGCAVGTGRTPIDPWGDFSPGRWLWFLDDVEALLEPVPAVGRQSFWRWVGDAASLDDHCSA